jgi:hypothetical protein
MIVVVLLSGYNENACCHKNDVMNNIICPNKVFSHNHKSFTYQIPIYFFNLSEAVFLCNVFCC